MPVTSPTWKPDTTFVSHMPGDSAIPDARTHKPGTIEVDRSSNVRRGHRHDSRPFVPKMQRAPLAGPFILRPRPKSVGGYMSVFAVPSLSRTEYGPFEGRLMIQRALRNGAARSLGNEVISSMSRVISKYFSSALRLRHHSVNGQAHRIPTYGGPERRRHDVKMFTVNQYIQSELDPSVFGLFLRLSTSSMDWTALTPRFSYPASQLQTTRLRFSVPDLTCECSGSLPRHDRRG